MGVPELDPAAFEVIDGVTAQLIISEGGVEVIWLDENDGSRVGFAHAQFDGEDVIWREMYIHPDWQKKRLGAAATALTPAQFKANGFKRFVVDAFEPGARTYFLGLGYEEEEETGRLVGSTAPQGNLVRQARIRARLS